MKKYLLILILTLIPTFGIMLRYGIYTMHDFHVFRQFEFDKCIQNLTFPCRWAPDAGLGYGEPVFNYYAQFPYWVGQVFRFLSFSVIDSTKISFGLTIVLSAVTMYFWPESFGEMLERLFLPCYMLMLPIELWTFGLEELCQKLWLLSFSTYFTVAKRIY